MPAASVVEVVARMGADLGRNDAEVALEPAAARALHQMEERIDAALRREAVIDAIGGDLRGRRSIDRLERSPEIVGHHVPARCRRRRRRRRRRIWWRIQGMKCRCFRRRQRWRRCGERSTRAGACGRNPAAVRTGRRGHSPRSAPDRMARASPRGAGVRRSTAGRSGTRRAGRKSVA